MGDSRNQLLAEIAYLYYVEERTQEEISDYYNIYRTTVSRMLKEARDKKIVQFNIEGYDTNIYKLENLIREKYRLKYVKIANSVKRDEEILDNIGQAAASLIRRVVDDNQIIGISWGRTLWKVIENVKPKKLSGSVVVPLTGGPDYSNAESHINTLVYELANKLNADNIYVNAAVIQEHARIAECITDAKYFEELNKAWEQIDVAIIGVGGNLDSKNSSWRDILTREDKVKLEKTKVVGDVLCRFFDDDCQEVYRDLSKRTISISIDKLKATPTVMAVAYGDEKVSALQSLMNNQVINSLVTDENTAYELLK